MNQLSKTYIFYFAFLINIFIFSISSFSSSFSTDDNKKEEKYFIKKIKIEGAKRTKEKLIHEKLGKIKKNSYITLEDIDEATRSLNNTQIFSKVEIYLLAYLEDFDENNETVKYVLVVELEERWTIIPIPYYFSSEEEYQFGLILLDTNLWGLNHIAGTYIKYTNKGWNVILNYNAPSLLWKNIMLNFFYSYNKNTFHEYEYDYDEEDYVEVDRLDRDLTYASLSLGYFFDNRLLLVGGPCYQYQWYNYLSLGNERKEKGGFGMLAIARLDLSEFKILYNEGFSFLFKTEIYPYLNNERYFTLIDSRAHYTFPTFGKQSFKISLFFSSLDGDTESFGHFIGGNVIIKGFPNQGIWGTRYFVGLLEYQIPVFSIDFGTITLNPYFNVGYVKNVPDTLYAEGVGINFYLNKIAIPALGIYGNYNHMKELSYSFQLGVTF